MNRLLRCIFLLCCCMMVSGFLWAQDGRLLQTPFTPSFSKGSIQSFFESITEKTGISISYSTAVLNGQQKVRMHGNEQSVSDVLKTIVGKQPLKIVERSDKILIVPVDAPEDASTATSPQFFPTDGYVKDKSNKEALIGASIYFPALSVGAVTNSFGFYSITLPRGIYKAYISYIGYKTDTVIFTVNDHRRVDMLLQQDGSRLREVKVSAHRANENNGDYIQLSLRDIARYQSLLGETDVMRALQMYPGVQSGLDGTSGIQVRGGDPGQNLNLLDGVPLYYVDHLFGVTSVYNSDAIKSVDFYKGAFPARYGGRLSSIVDVHTKDGDMQTTGGQFTMGLVKASLMLEGPILKDRCSYMVSARRTWIDGLFAPFYSQVGVNFYDINAKVNYILNDDNHIYLSFYNGRDQIRYSENDAFFRTRWGNTIASAKWNSILNPKFFLNTIFTYSQFSYELKDQNQVIDSGIISNLSNYVGVSSIKDISLQLQGQWFPNYRHKVEFGGNYARTYFVPTEIQSTDSKVIVPPTKGSGTMLSNELTVYAEDEIKVSKRFTTRLGLHWANWYSGQYDYSSLQPRVYASYDINDEGSLYGSLSHMAQFLHLINNNTYGLPTDFWVPSTKIIKPEEAYQATLGYNSSIAGFHGNVEIYYKDMRNVITYTAGKTLFDNSDNWQQKVEQGRGWAYGAELSLEKRIGPVSASLAYTLAWNWRQFDDLNNGDPFPYRYDRRHNIKIAGNYRIKKGIRFIANWTFMSGEAFTLPDQVYPDFDNNLLITQGNASSTSYTYHYSKWNDYRLPAIHRLDIGMDFVKKKKNNLERTWSVGIFNAYARKNVMFVTLTNDVEKGTLQLQGLSYLQFIPYVTYKLKF